MVEMALKTNFLWSKKATAYLDTELTLNRFAWTISWHVMADVTQKMASVVKDCWESRCMHFCIRGNTKNTFIMDSLHFRGGGVE